MNNENVDSAREIREHEERNDAALDALADSMTDAPAWARELYALQVEQNERLAEILGIMQNIHEMAKPTIDKFANGPLGKMLGGF